MFDKVHGLHSTTITLNERFTLLAAATVDRVVNRPKPRPRRRSTGGNFTQNFNQNNTFRSQHIIQQIAWQLERQAKKQALRQRIGSRQGNLRRFGSEGNLQGLKRSNSFGNLNQNNLQNRIQWRQSNGNIKRAGSFSSLAGQAWRLRGFRRRGGGARALRGRFWGTARGVAGRTTRVTQQALRRGNASGNMRGNARANMRGNAGANMGGNANGNVRGKFRGRGAAGVQRQQPKPVPSKEELDQQLEQYMAGTKTALDRELDEYMKNIMEQE